MGSSASFSQKGNLPLNKGSNFPFSLYCCNFFSEFNVKNYTVDHNVNWSGVFNDINNGSADISIKEELLIKAGVTFDVEDIKTVLIGDKENTLVPDTKLNYTSVNDTKLNSIVAEVNSFLELVFSLNTDFNFTKNKAAWNKLIWESKKDI